jgi:rod shape-determining protein MreD
VSPVRVALSTVFLFFIFAIQESVISRVHLPITGFSLYLAVLICLIALEDRNGAVIMGFIGGLVLDLSPSSQSPFGQWALIFTIIGYLISSNMESVGDFTSEPISFVLFISTGAAFALFIYLIAGLALGENIGSFYRAIVVVAGNFIWTMLFTPLFIPLIRRAREATLTSRERM